MLHTGVACKTISKSFVWILVKFNQNEATPILGALPRVNTINIEHAMAIMHCEITSAKTILV